MVLDGKNKAPADRRQPIQADLPFTGIE